MIRTYKTEVVLGDVEKSIFHQTVGICRYMYNLFITTNRDNQERDAKGKKVFITAYSFNYWINNTYLPNHPDLIWIKDAASHPLYYAVKYAEAAYKNFFKGKTKFPKFKKKRDNYMTYHVCNSKVGPNPLSTGLSIGSGYIKVPVIGIIRLKEKRYIPTNIVPQNACLSYKGGRYYISVGFKQDDVESNEPGPNGVALGVSLGGTALATCSDGTVYRDVNNDENVIAMRKKIHRITVEFGRKQRGTIENPGKNWVKTKQKLTTAYINLQNYMDDYANKAIHDIVSKPVDYIVIAKPQVKKDLQKTDDTENHKSLHNKALYKFYDKLNRKCQMLGVKIVESVTKDPGAICSDCGCHGSIELTENGGYLCRECGCCGNVHVNIAKNLAAERKNQLH